VAALATAAVALWAGSPTHILGQFSMAPDIGLVAGIMSYDTGSLGEGTTGFGGLRVRFPLSRFILVEPGITYTKIQADTLGRAGDVDTPLVTAEFQFQVQLPRGRYRPYVGIGAGGIVDFRDDRGHATEEALAAEFLVSTYSGALGVALDAGRWSFRTEVRRRWIDDFEDEALEVALGIVLAF
jgi:hypothetical protein